MTVNELIEEVENIRLLKYDWDGLGALPITSDLCSRVIMSLQENLDIEGLEINPSPDGSLDLSWRKDDFKMLINLPWNLRATYYGEKGTNECIKGKFNYFNGIPYYISEFINSNLR